MKTFYPIVWTAFIICLFLVWFFSHRASHKERLMMIEKGLDTEEHKKKNPGFRFPWQKIGIVIIGLSMGLLLIAFFSALGVLEIFGNAFPLALLGICGGIAMVIANNFKGGKSGDSNG